MTKILFITKGCAVNHADSETMQGLLKQAGYEITTNIDESELIVYNSCTVKSPSENSFYRELRIIKKDHPKAKIIIAGCLPQAERKEEIIKRFPDYSVIGTMQLDKICRVVEETLQGNKVYYLEKNKDKKRLSMPIVRKNRIIEIIPTNNGCLGNCTYCKTKLARGKLFSYPEKEIIKRVNDSLSAGVKEIWLTSQDLGAYGKDIGSSLPNLLESIIKIDGDFKVRLGMMNPDFAKRYAGNLVKLMKSEKIFRFLHIPVQSGNDRILKLMKRRYSADDFRKTIDKLRKAMPDVTIATDVIVGFPTETEEEFMDTARIIEELGIDVLNLSRFWPRLGTKAALMKGQVHGNVSKKRSQYLAKRFDSVALQRNKFWEGKRCRILIDEEGKNNTFVGRNDSYKPVIVRKGKLGASKDVVIKEARKFDLIG